MWSTLAGGHLMKVVNMTGFTLLQNTLTLPLIKKNIVYIYIAMFSCIRFKGYEHTLILIFTSGPFSIPATNTAYVFMHV
jgi:hypothetical protein